MSRALTVTLFVLSVVVLPLFASVSPVAPMEPRFAENMFDDIAPRAASDGSSTLVVWENDFSVYQTAFSVRGAFVDPQDGKPTGVSFRIESSAVSPRVATNGDEYLVAYGIGLSRFISWPYPTVAVRTVQRDGTVGPPQTINVSTIQTGATDVVWAGDHWIVAFSDGPTHLAFLRRDLQPFAPTVDAPALARLLTIGSHAYAFAATGTALEAYDVTSGQLDKVASTPLLQNGQVFAVPTRDGALIAVAGSSTVLTAFSPATGFSPSTPIASNAIGAVLDFAPFGDGFVLLHRSPGGGNTLAGSSISENGTVLETQQLLQDVRDATLFGSLLLISTTADPRANGAAIVSYVMSRLEPQVEANGNLVSIVRTDFQSAPVLVAAGSHAMLFWNQSIDDAGTPRAFSREIDASGQPVGVPTELPFAMGSTPRGAFDGSRFILSWTTPGFDLAFVEVDADGKTASPVATMPRGLEQYSSIPEIRLAAANDHRFALWTANRVLTGTPIDSTANPLVPGGFPLLPSIRPQAKADLSTVLNQFIAVWTEDDLIGAMLLSPAGTPSGVHMIGTAPLIGPFVAGDSESALAVWLSAAGAPLFVPFDSSGGSFDLFDPHWGDHYDAIAVASSGIPSHYFVGLIKDDLLLVGQTGQQGGFLTELGPIRPIAPTDATTFALAGVQGRPIAVWEADRRVWIANGDATRQRATRH